MTEIEEQIIALWAAWAVDSQSEQTARLLNGLFELMQAKYPDEMMSVFEQATRRD